MRCQSARLDHGDFRQQQFPHVRVFIPKIDVGRFRFDCPGGDEDTFEKSMRVRHQIMPVLEGAGLTLVGIDRQQSRSGIASHDPPLAAGRKAGTAQALQARLVKGRHDRFERTRPAETGVQGAIAAIVQVIGQATVCGHARAPLPGPHCREYRVGAGTVHVPMPYLDDRRLVAAAHAGGPDHTHTGVRRGPKS